MPQATGHNITITFDAHTFYAGLRAAGANSCVRQHPDGGLGKQFAVGRPAGVTGDVELFYAWAMEADSDWALRKAYARAVWDSQPAGDLPVAHQFVPLGCAQ
jgi:hypothetical protein